MLFRVRGTNKDTNALMVLDIEAANRSAAEYKAQARGMNVTDVEDVTAAQASHPTSVHRGEGPPPGSTPDSGGMRNLIVFAVVFVAAAVTGYFLLPITLQNNVAAPPPATTQATP
jgi:hypothetical protein